MAHITHHNAGFYLQYLWLLKDKLDTEQGQLVNAQIKTLSCFTVRSSLNISSHHLPDYDLHIVNTYSNLLSRGLPTFPSILVEQTVTRSISNIIQIPIREEQKAGSITFKHTNVGDEVINDWKYFLVRAHFPIETRLPVTRAEFELFDSSEEADFYCKVLLAQLGPGITQMFEPQRWIDSMLPIEQANSFTNQRVDFALEIPKFKLVIEIDGQQHQERGQKQLDLSRDAALRANGWTVERLQTTDSPVKVKQQLNMVSDLLDQQPAVEFINQNVADPLLGNEPGLAALIAVLTPYAVARVQMVLLDALKAGILSFDQPTWTLAIYERDVPCGALAVLDFIQHLQFFYRLMGLRRTLPEVKLGILSTREFAQVWLEIPQSDLDTCRIKLFNLGLKNDSYPTHFDLRIDLSMLHSRSLIAKQNERFEDHPKLGMLYTIRSVYSFKETRKLASSKPVSYQISDQAEPDLTFFLKNVFRKQSFREGQFKIIQRSLQLKPVIGLLPTGAGKSLCYQFSALLQPGLTIIVDPLISLMHDQIDNLKSFYAFDWVGHIDSSLNARGREKALQEMSAGKLQLIFIAPERFQNKEFRGQLAQFSSTYMVPYAVIDEAHCVSEWGHDFRTAYLKLAGSIQKYCRYFTSGPVIIALTGTASYVVLEDVQREIGILEEEAKVYPESLKRDELHFRTISTLTRNKYDTLLEILQQLPMDFETATDNFFQPDRDERTMTGIVFVPHASNVFGADRIAARLQNDLKFTIHYFNGKMDNSSKFDAQRNFKDNKFPLLVATKAFGMGIDKPNIRYTIHYNIPQSVEAFYQEAGRAGRDKEPAHCWIIFSDDDASDANAALTPFATSEVIDRVKKGFDKGDIHRLLYLHRNSFRGKEAEYNEMKTIYSRFFYNKLVEEPYQTEVDIDVPFGEGENQRSYREKALYRFSILGLVKDYTLDYRTNYFQVCAVKLQDQDYITNLQKYVQRYKPLETVAQIPAQINTQPDQTILGKCVSFLLDFVYQEIETKRRMMIGNMADIVREASKRKGAQAENSYMWEKLQSYLDASPYTTKLLKIKERVEPSDWEELLSMEDENGVSLLKNINSAKQLYGGVRRYLESFPDHPGYLFLSAIARLLSGDGETRLAEQDLSSCIQALGKYPQDLQARVGRYVYQALYYRLQSNAVRDQVIRSFVTTILRELPNRLIAREFYFAEPEACKQILLNLTLIEMRSFTFIFTS